MAIGKHLLRLGGLSGKLDNLRKGKKKENYQLLVDRHFTPEIMVFADGWEI